MFEFSEFVQVVLCYGCTLFAVYRLYLVLYSPSKARWDTTLLSSLVNVYRVDGRVGVDTYYSLQTVW